MQQKQEKEVDVYYIVEPIFFFSRFCGLWIHSLKVVSCFATAQVHYQSPHFNYFFSLSLSSPSCFSCSLYSAPHRQSAAQVCSIIACSSRYTSIAFTLTSTVSFGSPSLGLLLVRLFRLMVMNFALALIDLRI